MFHGVPPWMYGVVLVILLTYLCGAEVHRRVVAR